jgi:hypothetical protein
LWASFSGTFTSPDGKWKLSVTDAGIEASGPNAQLLLDNNGVLVKSGTTLVLDASATLDLKAASTATLRGSATRLGCTSGGAPVARVGSQVMTSGLPAGNTEPGQITQGSQTVFSC